MRTVSLLLLACFLSGCATVGRNMPGLHNFAQVDAGQIYRGAQPSPDGIARLSSDYHVATVINLRGDGPDWEAAATKSAGMEYHQVPSSAFDVDSAKVREVLNLLCTAPRPIFIHCRQGRDRTGLEVAIYRITQEHWTREAALEELYAHGHNSLLFWDIRHFIKSFKPDQFPQPKAAVAAAQAPLPKLAAGE